MGEPGVPPVGGVDRIAPQRRAPMEEPFGPGAIHAGQCEPVARHRSDGQMNIR